MNDFEKRLRESKKEISESKINNPHEIYQNASARIKKKTNLKFNSNLFLKFAMIILMIVTITVSSVAIYKVNHEKTIVINPIINVIQGLNGDNSNIDQLLKFKDKEQLENLIKNSTKGSADYEAFVNVEDVFFTGIAGAQGPQGEQFETESNSNDREYNTNIQEENVDEADIVKVNGDYIYYIPYSEYSNYYDGPDYKNLYILKANGSKLDLVKKINYADQVKLVAKDQDAVVHEHKITKPQDLFYTDKYLVIRLQTRIYDRVIYQNKKNTSYNRYYTEYAIYDMEDYELVKNVVVPGNFVSARLINDELYIINNYSNMKTDNMYFPRYYIDGVPGEASIDNIYYNPAMGTNLNSYVIVFKLKLGKNIKIDQFYFISPVVNNIYMTEDTLYLLRQSSYATNIELTKRVQFPITQILALNIQEEITAKGMVTVVGKVNNKYWIDEHEGYLRVASTGTQYIAKMIVGKYAYDIQSEVFNYVTIFSQDDNGKYEEIGSIREGLGEPGESMKSARFEGDVATIVTFKQTDPLYYVDLSDPFNPKITSELKVSGYTVYQHPYKDNYVIGIGYEANSDGRTTGYKVALFDISNKNDIKQVGESIVFKGSDGYTVPPVINNPKALFLDLENDIFGFEIMQYQNALYARQVFKNKYFTFKIDLSKESPLSIFSEFSVVTDYMGVVDRMVFIKDKYYLLRSDFVMIYDLKATELVYVGSLELN